MIGTRIALGCCVLALAVCGCGERPVIGASAVADPSAPAEDAQSDTLVNENRDILTMDAFLGRFMAFDPFTIKGSGGSEVDLERELPEAVFEALNDEVAVTCSHTGQSEFQAEHYDLEEPEDQVLWCEVAGDGSEVSTVRGGLISRMLRVAADGGWTITISPIPSLDELPAEGQGSSVVLYSGEGGSWVFQNEGGSFRVEQEVCGPGGATAPASLCKPTVTTGRSIDWLPARVC